MRFLIRNIEAGDIDALFRLADRTLLYSLEPDRKSIERKIDTSVRSFTRQAEADEANFIFVIEDLHQNKLIGSSQMTPHYISSRHPHYVFQVRTRGDGGQVLKLHRYTGGMSLLCGLVVDPAYRRSNEFIGRQVSLIRLLFAGMVPECFESSVFGELLPPLDKNRNNPFWEGIGKKFTNLSYEDALMRIKLRDYSFVENFYPKEEIFLSADQTALHRNRSTVFPPTLPSQRIIEKQGLQYLEEVCPVDGGLQYGVELDKVSIIRNGEWFRTVPAAPDACTETALAGVFNNYKVRGGRISCKKDRAQKTIGIPEETLKQLDVSPGEKVFAGPF